MFQCVIMDCFNFKPLFSSLDAPTALPRFGPQQQPALKRFRGEEHLPIWDVRLRVDASDLSYLENPWYADRPGSLISLAGQALVDAPVDDVRCLYRPEVPLEVHNRLLFREAGFTDLEDLNSYDWDHLHDQYHRDPQIPFSYYRYKLYLVKHDPRSFFALIPRNELLRGVAYEDVLIEMYANGPGNLIFHQRDARTYTLERLAFSFFLHFKDALIGNWQEDIPALCVEGAISLYRKSYLPWLNLYQCSYHNPRQQSDADYEECNNFCDWDMYDFQKVLMFLYAFYYRFDYSTFINLPQNNEARYFINNRWYYREQIARFFHTYMYRMGERFFPTIGTSDFSGRDETTRYFERFFPTLGPQSQRKACARLVQQVNKITKIKEQKKARKEERQLKHIERRALYKIQRAQARDEKFQPSIGAIGISKRIMAAIPHFSRGVRALFTGEVELAVIERWLLMFTPILCSPTPGGFFSAFLCLLNNLGISIISAASELMHYCTQFVKKFANSALRYFDNQSELLEHPIGSAGIEQAQPTLGEEEPVEGLLSHTSDTRKLDEMIRSYGLKTPALFATILAGAAATVAAYLVGSQPTNTRFKLDAWDRLISGCSNLSKFKSGAYAYISIMRDFCAWTYTLVEDNIMDGQDSALVRLVKNVSLEDVPAEGLVKADFFEMYNYITNAVNLPVVITNHVWRTKAKYVERVLQEICGTLAKSVLIDRDTAIARDTAGKMLAAVQKINSVAFKNHSEKFARMRPCVFMFQGNPGTGKSVYQVKFANTLMDVLYKKNEFDVPPTDRIVSVNFTDKYLTGYKNQYCVLVDDIFQDREGAIEGSSSALQFISWISNAPYGTVQADLNSKGILFESKLVVCSSNVAEPSSNSIQSNDALIRRIDYQIRCEPDNNAESQEELGGRRVRFDVYKPAETAPGIWKLCKYKSFANLRDLVKDALTFYIAHYRKEKRILESRQATPELIESLYNEVFPEEIYPSGGYISKVKDMVFEDKEAKFHALPDLYQCYEMALKEGWLVMEGGVLVQGPKYLDLKVSTRHDLDNIVAFQNEGPVDYTDYYVRLSTSPRISQSLWRQYHTALSEKLTALSNTRIGRCLNSLIEKCGGGARMLMGGLGIAGIALAGVSLYHYFKRSEDVFEEEPSGVRYDSGRPRRVAKRSKASRAFASGMFDARDDPSSDTIVDTLIGHSSCVKISFQASTQKFVQTAIRLKNTCILTNEHFFTFMIQAFKETGKQPKFSVEVPINGTIKVVNEIFDETKLCTLPGKDAAVYNCSRSMPAAREIVSYFPPADRELPETTRCSILRTSPNAFVSVLESSDLYASFNTKMAAYEYPDLKGEMRPFVMQDSWLVPVAGKRGESGSLLICQNRQMREKLLGIQSSVGERSGTFFEPINSDDLYIALSRVGCEEPVCIDSCGALASLGVDQDYESPTLISKESLIYMGQIKKELALAPPEKTKLVQSLVYDEEKSRMGPSVMRKDDPRLDESVRGENLLMLNMQGYDTQIGPVDQKVLEESTEELAQYLSSVYNCENIPNKILDEVEMINGSPGVYKAMDMTTSPGFPFVKKRKHPELKGKFEWFEEYEEPHTGRKMYSMKEELRARLELRESEAKQGRRLKDSFGYTCLKDEKRTHEKIKNGKTRVFICLPMDYNLLIRKYFGAFVASQHHKAALPGIASCVGIDPLHSWKTIHTELSKKNLRWEDFDYANWDQSLHPAFFEAYARIVSEFYGDSITSENHRVRSVLMHELCYTFLIMNNSLVFKTSGQCSGCAITAEINCTIHELLMVYSYKLFWRRKGEFKTITDFLLNCAIRVYGDDILFSTSEKNGFCGEQHRIIAEELGMRITTAQKDLNFRVKDPSECTFLKRSFVYDDRFSTIICPIKKEVIEEIPYWIHKSDDPLAATIVNVNCALLEAFLCGKDYFNNLRSLFAGRLEKVQTGASQQLETYSYFLNQYELGKFKVLALRDDTFEVSEN